MSLAQHAVANPAGERLHFLLELKHPDWVAPLRYAEGFEDVTATLETAEVATFTADGFDAEAGASDDSGIDSRALRVPDKDLALWRLIEANIGSSTPITAILRVYSSADLTAPLAVATLQLSDPQQGVDRSVQFDATTVDTLNRGAPTLRYTVENSPGLRR